MGGARCSFRNCTQRSDQVTHMFHFPVFDKVRCHQWISNAQKLNFLDLKLSQLQNRVICQHHFTDDSFMNSLKNKLKKSAVPTLNGPLCASLPNTLDYKEEQGDRESEMPINIDDIENEVLPKTEKKAHFSVKYGDFLTNDVTESLTLDPRNTSITIELGEQGLIFNRLPTYANRNFQFNKPIFKAVHKKRPIQIKPMIVTCKRVEHPRQWHNQKDEYITDAKLTPSPTEHNKVELNPATGHKVELNHNPTDHNNVELNPNPTEHNNVELNLNSVEHNNVELNPNSTEHNNVELNPNSIEQDKTNNPGYIIFPPQPNINQVNQNIKPEHLNVFISHKKEPSSTPIPLTKRVKIISEKHLSTQFKIPKGEFQPVSPSVVINVPKKENNYNVEANKTIQTVYVDNNNIGQPQKSQQIDNDSEASLQVRNPLAMTECMQTSTFSDYITSINNPEVSREIIIPIEYLESDSKHSQQIQKMEMFSNNEDNTQPVPSGEYVNSFTEPAGFTIEVPPATTSVSGTSYIQSMSEVTGTFPTIEVLTPSTDQVTKNKATNDKSEASKNIVKGDMSEKQVTQKSSSPTKSAKNKINPDKLAEIEEKRKYNMKLRDIINSCLNNIEEEPESIKLTSNKKKQMNAKKVGEHLLNVSSQDNNIAYFEARLQRLEDTLLNKIEQNSQKITDLRKLLKLNTSKKAASTQTYQSSEATKKNLYHQISQFLSPDANNLIYEELFINSCVSKKLESPRKRKRRL